jgi:hypothetical protein
MIAGARDGRWTKPSREHWEAVDAFLEAAMAVSPARWREPLGTGRWTPAQLSEHVLRTYEASIEQLRGDLPTRIRVGPVAQRLLRWVLLPHILFRRSIPLRSRSPGAITPSEKGVEQSELTARLREAAEVLHHEFRTTASTHLLHPYFGALDLRTGMRFVAAHTDHHRKQLSGALAAPSGPRS